MDLILNKIMDFLQQHESMDDDKEEIVRYGLEICILKALFTICTIIIGILMHSFFECVVFLVFFSFLRSNAGGHHADTRLQCFFESMLSYTAVIAVLNIAHSRFYAMLAISLATLGSSVFIWVYAPVDTHNKRLDQNDCKYFAVKTKIILFIEIAITLIALFFMANKIACSSMLAIILTAILLLMGMTKNTGKDSVE